MGILFYLAAITLLILIISVIEAIIGGKSIKYLKDIPPLEKGERPKVSIIIPARNEDRHIEAALTSALAQDYDNLEIIVVNDRSTDETKSILDRLGQTRERLKVLHLSELPEGWLGKTHALYRGAQMSDGDFLLFTDADVYMEETVVSRAVNYMLENRFDHIVIGPEIKMRGALLSMLMLSFACNFLLFQRPWRAKNPRSRRSVGGGAFSLARREAYEASGGMRAIALCIVDDLKLGKLIKSRGFRQDFLGGQQMLGIEWYPSTSAMIAGLTKNTFAVFDYSIVKTALGIAGLVIFNIWPFFGLALTGGITRILYGLIILIVLGIYLKAARLIPIKAWHAFGYPIANAIFCYIISRSAFTTLINRGVHWRGTFYPLDELKRNNL